MVAQAPRGKRLGRYEVIRHLASGGMAEIYLAQGVGEMVVVKVISADRAQDKKFVQMFLDEARVAATLHHPNIAQMLEVGRQDDTYFFAMEYIHGETARALLERAVQTGQHIPLAVSLKIVSSVAAGLHHAHERRGATGQVLQIVHRDVTPSNIMIGVDGSVKLLDFGIAQAEGRAAETQSGTIKGKFAYMSPEQCRGKSVDRRTDVFALGIVLYELTTRRRAFRTDSDFDTMDRIVRGRWTRPTQLDPYYPRELEAILERAMAIELPQRYATAAELARAVDDFAERHGLRADAGDVAHFVREMFQTTDLDTRAVSEGTMSEVELSISAAVLDEDANGPTIHDPSLAALHGLAPPPGAPRGPAGALMDAALSSSDDDDAASTQRRMRAPMVAALEAAHESMQAEHTGPMPVLPPARATGPLDVPIAIGTQTGPQPLPPTSTGEHPRPPAVRAEGTASEVRAAGAGGRTILGTAVPQSIRRRPANTGPSVAPSMTDSGRGPAYASQPNLNDAARAAMMASAPAPVAAAADRTSAVRDGSRGLLLPVLLGLLLAGGVVAVLFVLGVIAI